MIVLYGMVWYCIVLYFVSNAQNASLVGYAVRASLLFDFSNRIAL